MTKSRKDKQRKRLVVSVVLIAAVLISGAFAFLTAQDSKTNVFTIGNIDISLIEDFDTNQNGEIDSGETYDNNNGNIPVVTNVIPGQQIIKRPYVKNTGDNPCYLFMSVKVPTISTEEAFAKENQKYLLDEAGVQRQIVVTAYALQDNYGTPDKTNSKWISNVWDTYFNSAVKNWGDETRATDRVQLFDINGIDTEKWEQIKTHFTDDSNYYVFVYKGDKVDGVPNYLIPKNTTTSPLFDNVSLKSFIGNPSGPISATNGARIETVKVLTESGETKTIQYICGLKSEMSASFVQSCIQTTGDVSVKYDKATGRYYGTGSTVTVTSNTTGQETVYYIVVYGDVNGDGQITLVDSSLLRGFLNGTSTLTDVQKIAARVSSTDKTGEPTVEDADLLESVISNTAIVIDQTTGTVK